MFLIYLRRKLENHEAVPSLANIHAALIYHLESNYIETCTWICDTFPSILYGDWSCQENIFVYALEHDCETLVSNNMDLVNDHAIYWRDPYGNTILHRVGPKVRAFLVTTPLYATLITMEPDQWPFLQETPEFYASMVVE